ncbi:hypothetical protein FNB15_00320 [Ferrovibrio terrae]|uniref:Uncharacterized protein n=1 Tax=Ferrovibrio terrae TaxID=2594003 RepID=A0A516GWE2_9PROT|nr:hypothetical protein [Ferrovibrio terrae]QDO95822.1 hypothetical protein FNB15_00320 [Ferrovibrio terrae]
MTRKYAQIPPPESANPAGTCGSAIADNPVLASPASIDLAAEAAAFEACQVSAMLAAAAMSLTNLSLDAMPRLLQRP